MSRNWALSAFKAVKIMRLLSFPGLLWPALNFAIEVLHAVDLLEIIIISTPIMRLGLCHIIDPETAIHQGLLVKPHHTIDPVPVVAIHRGVQVFLIGIPTHLIDPNHLIGLEHLLRQRSLDLLICTKLTHP
ncbi:UNVERIFIED_CONTAM: hypothetical protein K2H54_060783 [Gekko kuhli]